MGSVLLPRPAFGRIDSVLSPECSNRRRDHESALELVSMRTGNPAGARGPRGRRRAPQARRRPDGGGAAADGPAAPGRARDQGPAGPRRLPDRPPPPVPPARDRSGWPTTTSRSRSARGRRSPRRIDVAFMTEALEPEADRQGLRGRHRLGLPGGDPLAAGQGRLLGRDPRAAGQAGRRGHQGAGLHQHPHPGRRRLRRLARGRAVRRDHRHLRPDEGPAAAGRAAQGGGPDGHPAGRPVRPGAST